MKLLIVVIMLGNLTTTAYRPISSQTDNSPTWTSEGDRTTKYGCAVSQDLLESKRIKYGDVLYIEGVGMRVVNDCMNKRHKNRIDILVYTRKEEKDIGVKSRKVYLIQHKGE